MITASSGGSSLTLDKIPAPVNNVAMNSKKITNLANAVFSYDATNL